jgi:hypothetical protein
MTAPVPGSGRRAEAEATSRAWIVAAVAACVPPVWFVLVFGGVPLFVLPAVLASAWLWLLVARELGRIAAPATRLLAALGFGLLSPPLGVLLTSVCGTCSCCGLVPLAAPSLFQLMFQQPLWFFPWGLGMGLVAFVVVGVRRTPRLPPPPAE